MTKTRRTFTVSLPPEMAQEVEKVRKVEHRTRSELVREALRVYFSTRFPTFIPSKADLAAIRRGRAEIQRGQYVTLEQLVHALERKDRKARKKST